MTTNSPEVLPRILCVDDEPHLLAALQRILFDRYELLTATNAGDALTALKHEPPFEVVISDMRMPGMNGAEFLAEVRRQYPAVTRILLTGHADTESAIAAVNHGAIFRFLSKPCPTDELIAAIEAGIALHRREQVERQLLATTLSGVVKLLSELLSMAAPAAAQRSSFLQACVRHALPKLGWSDPWRYQMAAELSQIGWIGVPDDDEDPLAANAAHAQTAWRLLAPIPRLESIALMLRYQTSVPPEEVGSEVLQGATLLRAGLQLHRITPHKLEPAEVLRRMRQAKPALPTSIIEALADFRGAWSEPRMEKIEKLELGTVLDEDVRTKNGMLVLSSGHELTQAAILALQRLRTNDTLEASVRVRSRLG